jgi:hypothetical protein
MSYVICPLSVIPIRASASHSSEMVSQLLFGELAEVLETKGRQWLRLRCHWDNLVGWANANQLQPITPSEFATYQQHFAYCLELTQPVVSDDYFLPVTLGAQLPDYDGIRLKMGGITFTFSGQAVFPGDMSPSVELMLKIARRYLHAPYLSGGRSPFGIDSGGFLQMVFKLLHIRLPREAAQQVFGGEAVDFVEQAQAGDLAFFEDRQGRINHTGIILPEHRIIHAYGKVRVDNVDHFGIYNLEQNRYTHRLRVVKRLLPLEQPKSDYRNEPAVFASNQIQLF